MNVDTLDFKTLPLSERIQLVEDIWDSIAAETSGRPLFVAEDMGGFQSRMAAHQANPDSSIPWEQVRAQLFGKQS